MKTRFLSLLCTALFAAGILLGAATASAHGMTYWEATLVLDDTATGGQNQLEPRKATLADARRAIVRAGLADDYQGKDFTGDGMRFVTFDFNYAEHFIFRAVTGAKDTRDAGHLTITSYDVMGQSSPPAHTRLMTKPLRSPSTSTTRASFRRSSSAPRSESICAQKSHPHLGGFFVLMGSTDKFSDSLIIFVLYSRRSCQPLHLFLR